MRVIRMLLRRARAIVRRESLEREMYAEMADHIDCEIAALVQRGVPPAEARRRALEGIGTLDLIHEQCRDARGVNWWEHFRQDLVFALRLLRRNPVYSAMAITTIALGIGSTTAVFSVADCTLLRPLAYPEPERLISVEGIGMPGPFEAMRSASAVADYAAHQGVRSFNLLGREGTVPERVKGSEVSANFFAVLGVAPSAGRTFLPDEDRPGRTRVAVLSHSFWTQRLGGRADAVGRQIVLDESAYEIAGIMPAGFAYPSHEVQVWVPMRLDPRSLGDYWGMGGTHMFARLRGTATLDAALAEVRARVPLIRAMFPWRMPELWGTDLQVTDLRGALTLGARTRTWMLLAAAGLVLLIAIVNVVNLMIGSTAARAREIALRVSLGATPGRISKQLLTEALVLTFAGGCVGVLAGYVQLVVLRWRLPATTPRISEVAMDGRVLVFATAVTLAAGLVVGAWPALRVRSRASLTSAGQARRSRAGGVLVMTEAALVTILLVGSCLLGRSLWTMLRVDPGFEVDTVVTAELTPSPSAGKRSGLWEEVRARLLRYPGVREAAAMNVLPMTPEITAFAAAIEDHPLPPQDPQYVLWSTSVTPEHAAVLGIKLLAGRNFSRADHARSEPVVMISKSTAGRFWPGRSAVGRRLKPVADAQWRTIIGVVDDVRTFGVSGPPSWVNGEVYVPLAQAGWSAKPVSLIVRVRNNPESLAKVLPGLIYEVCATCAVSKIAGMRTVVSRASETPRATASLFGGFTALALVIAAAGIYGVVNHSVTRRTRELGVRLALGAGRVRLARIVIGSSVRFVGVGCAIGLATAWPLVTLVRNLLFGIAPHDTASFGLAPAALLAVTVLASALPVVRALRIDPAECLREG